MQSRIWFGIFVGSTIGGFIPALWHASMLSGWGLLFSGVGAFIGLWIAARTD
jgi:hypothetical protein